jgi:hypothetical protein
LTETMFRRNLWIEFLLTMLTGLYFNSNWVALSNPVF